MFVDRMAVVRLGGNSFFKRMAAGLTKPTFQKGALTFAREREQEREAARSGGNRDEPFIRQGSDVDRYLRL